MTIKQAPCRAKDPSRCSYHGKQAPVNPIDKAKDKVSKVFAKKPNFEAPPLTMFPKGEVTVKLEVKPRNKNSKSGFTIEAQGADHEEAFNNLEKKIDELPKEAVKATKTGYTVEASYPRNPLFPDVQDKSFDTANDLDSIKAKVRQEKTDTLEEVQLTQATIQEMREQGEGSTPAGAKALAVVEAMAGFSYFRGSHANYDVDAAYSSVKSGTSEYTNRGYSIRAYFDYNHANGELSRVRFSLDNETSSWNTFSPKKVANVNKQLEEYFQRVDLASSKKKNL